MKHAASLPLLLALLTLTSAARAQQPTSEEQYLVDLINTSRAQAQLPPLGSDPQLLQVSRLHSYDMASQWFFSHQSPTTGSVHDRLRRAGVAYSSASENIAYDDSPWEAHARLMRAAPNREVMMSPEFTHVGVGVVAVGGRLMITETFLSAPSQPASSPWSQALFGRPSWSQVGRALASPWASGGPQAAAEVTPTPVAPQSAHRAPRRSSSRRSREPEQCSLQGRWQGVVPEGMLRAQTVTLDFWENGTARGTAGSVTLNTRWTRQADVVQITDTSATPSMAACPASQTGQYHLAFSEDCQAVTIVNSQDTCRHRNLTLQGLQARRTR